MLVLMLEISAPLDTRCRDGFPDLPLGVVAGVPAAAAAGV